MFDKDEYNCCEVRKQNTCADKIILSIFLIVFALTIGVIVGATTAVYTVLGQAIISVIAATLGVLIVIKLLQLYMCDNNNNKCVNNKDNCCR